MEGVIRSAFITYDGKDITRYFHRTHVLPVNNTKEVNGYLKRSVQINGEKDYLRLWQVFLRGLIDNISEAL